MLWRRWRSLRYMSDDLEIFSLSHVQALWSYSEIAGSNFAHLYDHARDIKSLRAKRREGVAFIELTPEERSGLASMCASIRRPLMIFAAGIDRFQKRFLTKPQIAVLVVPTMVLGRQEFMSFEAYMHTSVPDPNDARNVESTGEYRSPAHPLTVGRYDEHLILLDGYHRAATFWKFASADARIEAYCPAV